MRNLTKLTLGVALLAVCLALTGSASSTTSTEPSPQLYVSVDITLAAYGLTPGNQYAATFEALASEDDPYPYYLGYSAQTVGRGGYIRFIVGVDDLAYQSGKKLYEVKMWLRPPNSSVGAEPSLDPQERPLYVEQDFYR